MSVSETTGELPAKLPVDLPYYDEVYAYYGSDAYINRADDRPRLFSRAAHFLIDKLYDPQMSYGEGAEEGIAEAVKNGTPILVSCNHISNHDANIASAALKQNEDFAEIIRRNHFWTVTKDSLFRIPFARKYFDSRHLIPAFRPKSYRTEATIINETTASLREEHDPIIQSEVSRLKRLQLVRAGKMLNTLLTKHFVIRNSVAIFAEGTINKNDPKVVQNIGGIPLKAALDAIKDTSNNELDTIGLLTMGIYMGPNRKKRNSAVHVEFSKITDIKMKSEDLRTQMQTSVNGAVNQYKHRLKYSSIPFIPTKRPQRPSLKR